MSLKFQLKDIANCENMINISNYTIYPCNPKVKVILNNLLRFATYSIEWDPDSIFKPKPINIIHYKLEVLDDQTPDKHYQLTLIHSPDSFVQNNVVFDIDNDTYNIIKYANYRSGFATTLLDCISFEEMLVPKLEEIVSGRNAAILTYFYIVRSTTIYKNPPQKIQPAHMINNLRFVNNLSNSYKQDDLMYNNIMFEHYDKRYTTMHYHSDLSIDLLDQVGILALYPKGEQKRRKLMIKPKDKTSNEKFEIIMENKMMIEFNLDTNMKYVHKIVGEAECYILTFRKTFTNKLRLATAQEKKEFFTFKTLENNTTNFKWPKLPYTICLSEVDI